MIHTIPDDTPFRQRMSLASQTLEEEKKAQQQHVNIDPSDLFHVPHFQTQLPRTEHQFIRPPTWDTQMIFYDSRLDSTRRRSLLSTEAPIRIHQLTVRYGTFFIPTISEEDPPLLLYESHLQIAALQSPYIVRPLPGHYSTLDQLAVSLQTAIQQSGAQSHYEVAANSTHLTISCDRTGGDQLFILTIPNVWDSRLGTMKPDPFGVSYQSSQPCQIVHQWVYLFFHEPSRETLLLPERQVLSSLAIQIRPLQDGWYTMVDILDSNDSKKRTSVIRSAPELSLYANGVLTFVPSILIKSLVVDVQNVHFHSIHHMNLLLSSVIDRQTYST